VKRVAALAALLLALAAAAVRAATDTGPKLDVLPADVVFDMSTALRAPVIVLLHNPGHRAIARAKLDLIAPAGIDVTIVRSPRLPSSGDLTWRVDVGGNGAAPSPAKLVVLATYGTSGTGPPSPAVAAGTLAITLQPPVAAASALKTALVPGDGIVDELNPLDAQLLIENPTRRAVDVDGIATVAPAYVRIAPAAALRASIPPGGTARIPLHITSASAVPGTYALVVGFHARYRGAKTAESGVVQGKITVGVPGAGEAMQFLGIPSLLLLPGALVIITFTSVFTLLMRRAAIDWKQPWLLVLAVVLSFGAALLYPIVTRHYLGIAHDYLRGYDLRDVISIWMGSIVIGAAFACALAAVLKVQRWLDDRAARRLTAEERRLNPSTDDKPLDVLRKLLANNVAGFRLEQRRRVDGTLSTETLVQLPFGPADSGKRWLAHAAVVARAAGKQSASASQVCQDAIGATLLRIEASVKASSHDLREAETQLVRDVERGLLSNDIELRWDGKQGEGPRIVSDADYYPPDQARVPFLRVD